VLNNRMAEWVNPKAGQVFVQCWHGTPLKRLGYDVADETTAALNTAEELSWRYGIDARKWSYLLSPSPYTSERLASAFGLASLAHQPRIVEEGYPRNDLILQVLNSPQRDGIIAGLRRRLGIPEGRKVLLYAPTWRDSVYRAGTGYGLGAMPDFARLCAALGGQWVVLLRAHYLVEEWERAARVGADGRLGADGRAGAAEGEDGRAGAAEGAGAAADARSAEEGEEVWCAHGAGAAEGADDMADARSAEEGEDVRADFLIDVSGVSDINELYLVADALLTDYSSVLFDYANTARPVIYYWPDLDEYRRDIRGFYFDPATLPGDKCVSTDELINAIAALGTWEERYGSAHRAFRARFCPQDDGHATNRVIAEIFATPSQDA
jgi:CDP-glycerol glycerophosphotransferase